MKFIGPSGNLIYVQKTCRNVVRSLVPFARVPANLISVGADVCNSGLFIVDASWKLNGGVQWWYRYTDPISGPEALAIFNRMFAVSDSNWPSNNNGMGYNVVIKPLLLDKLTPAQFGTYLATH